MSATVTIRLDSELKQRLERLAGAMQRSKSFLAAQAIRDFVDLNEWQVQEIEQAVVEADRVNSPATRMSRQSSASGESVQVSWLAQALRNLDDEAEYISGENPAAAEALVKRIHEAVGQLQSNPAMGRPGRNPRNSGTGRAGYALHHSLPCQAPLEPR